MTTTSPLRDYAVTGLSTESTAHGDQLDVWTDEVRRNHGMLDLQPSAPSEFAGTTVVQRAGDLQLVEFWSDAVAYRRRPRDARRDGDETIRILVPRGGRFRVEADGRQLDLGSGSAAMVSMASAFTIAHDRAARAWVLSVPPDRLSRGLDPRTPRTVDLTAGAGAVALAMMRQISHERESLDAADFIALAESLASLMGREPGRDRARPSLVAAAAELVRRTCDDPALTPTTLAAQLGWSPRHVQVVLAATGTTPSKLIREARLERAAVRLRDPAWADQDVAAVAMASGFGSVSSFYDAFREAFGRSPGRSRG
ncbi:helix-turn-helix transcriptional regulator [Aeromicrobium stalagmiti]|uniref:helix-turn-helix transcriptional regulator n=1 Tax=Aeromicrobium stalagmiti TaxID=2738988 RepID=UPI001567CFA3|nr:AraC family transcriptional regulator [Aeromicrobium stalagmiti]NRQ49967.1 AraC family transcriptional regulator [Aeromicrobium stalagmiti]